MIGLIFDMDGVIVDNNDFHYKAWQQLAARHDIQIDEDFYREKMNGRTLNELMDVVFQGKIPHSEALAIGLEKEKIYRELYAKHLAPTPGLLELIATASEKEVPLVVGTSAPSENVVFTLDGLDLRKHFTGVVDDSMVTKGKPEPEVYLKCAAMINRDPQHCIVFEDAISGITAGQRAGAKVIALATSHKREELDADLIIDDFTQLRWEQIEMLIDS
ncbi:HAD family hydrolase [Marinoscillum furvescens]|uniref:HAD superfamily hydrolase (TIGR01509 family) n=1 Tax=Marinoscillum furvescens DSM 4134 TaxID=1122208 RepID=A0A3D9L274_MARFU|nr:HAD family phosphatase [Marinoscillum furvescens]RED97486.1 HAD superfamily hydrolase (TIGR01509 family) [Marinoscillum furvescens DSM 4134]